MATLTVKGFDHYGLAERIQETVDTTDRVAVIEDIDNNEAIVSVGNVTKECLRVVIKSLGVEVIED